MRSTNTNGGMNGQSSQNLGGNGSGYNAPRTQHRGPPLNAPTGPAALIRQQRQQVRPLAWRVHAGSLTTILPTPDPRQNHRLTHNRHAYQQRQEHINQMPSLHQPTISPGFNGGANSQQRYAAPSNPATTFDQQELEQWKLAGLIDASLKTVKAYWEYKNRLVAAGLYQPQQPVNGAGYVGGYQPPSLHINQAIGWSNANGPPNSAFAGTGFGRQSILANSQRCHGIQTPDYLQMPQVGNRPRTSTNTAWPSTPVFTGNGFGPQPSELANNQYRHGSQLQPPHGQSDRPTGSTYCLSSTSDETPANTSRLPRSVLVGPAPRTPSEIAAARERWERENAQRVADHALHVQSPPPPRPDTPVPWAEEEQDDDESLTDDGSSTICSTSSRGQYRLDPISHPSGHIPIIDVLTPTSDGFANGTRSTRNHTRNHLTHIVEEPIEQPQGSQNALSLPTSEALPSRNDSSSADGGISSNHWRILLAFLEENATPSRTSSPNHNEVPLLSGPRRQNEETWTIIDTHNAAHASHVADVASDRSMVSPGEPSDRHRVRPWIPDVPYEPVNPSQTTRAGSQARTKAPNLYTHPRNSPSIPDTIWNYAVITPTPPPIHFL